MAERMYPRYPDPTIDEEKLNPNLTSSTRPMLDQPSPPLAETFNVQLPGGAAAMTTHQRRCNGRRCCLVSLVFFIVTFIIHVIIYNVVGVPMPSNYSVDNVLVTVAGGGALNGIFHFEFDITISANNSSPKIRISYQSGSFVAAFTSNLLLATGTMPVFYQPTQNVTVFTVNTTGAVPYTDALSAALNGQNTEGMLPLVVKISGPVLLELAPNSYTGKTMAMNCNVLINSLENTNIVSQSCRASLLGGW